MSNDRILPTSRSSDLATLTIFSEGKALSRTANVISISITNNVNRIPTARLIFKDGDPAIGDFTLSNADELIPGKAIEIQAGYHSDNETIFSGIVIKQTVRAKSNNQSMLIVECKNKAYSMILSRKNRYFSNSKDSDAIEELLQAHSLRGNVESTTLTHQSLVQYNTSDWDFLMTRTEINGQFILLNNDDINIAKPNFSQAPIVTLTYGANLLTFDATLDASFQHSDVSTQTWASVNQEMSKSEASAAGIPTAGNLSSDDLSGLVSTGDSNTRHGGHLAEEELQAWADSRKLRHELSMIRGIARCTGLSQIIPGSIIKVAGVGERFNGDLYVTGIRHELSQGEWEMDIQFGIDQTTFAATTQISDIPAAGLLPAINGLQVGIVSQLQDDPDGEDRVLVKMPVIDSEAEGTWARIASLDAGKNRGTFFRPEIGDEVILGFINQDPRDPLILGMLNSSAKPAPVSASDDNHEKGFYTRDELKLVFNDELKSIRIDTPNGNVIQLSEDEGAILIEDENGNKLELNDSGITMESTSDINIKASGDINISGTNITLSANGNLKAEGSSGAELSSSGSTDIKGSLVNIN